MQHARLTLILTNATVKLMYCIVLDFFLKSALLPIETWCMPMALTESVYDTVSVYDYDYEYVVMVSTRWQTETDWVSRSQPDSLRLRLVWWWLTSLSDWLTLESVTQWLGESESLIEWSVSIS